MPKRKKRSSTKKPKKYIHRSNKQRIIGGVAGGVAEYLDIDPTIIRLIWAVGSLFWGIGLIAYLLAWIIIPLKK